MIEFRNVEKRYDDQTAGAALTDFNLTIGDGEFVFIIGESGAGKSTLLRLLMGEEKPTKGSVVVDGVNVGRIQPAKLPYYRRHFGMVYQDFRLLKDYTVYENVAFAQRVVNASPQGMKRRVPKILEKVGMADKADSLPAQLSGGEQQRAAIARAVVNGPLYLLADEPTGNLDPAGSREVLSLLEEINRGGTTVIVVTHDAPIVDKARKRVVTLREGSVVSDVEEGGYDNA
ncbi:MAG: cell division ATP-binding protein FtsE [Lachnospiraceae bacterium]|nr:cell division ATP-binding protein FtsE [Lachnospiraceae bacterium]